MHHIQYSSFQHFIITSKMTVDVESNLVLRSRIGLRSLGYLYHPEDFLAIFPKRWRILK